MTREDLKHCGKMSDAREEFNISVSEGRIESRYSFGRFVHLHILEIEHKSTNMFISIIIYFTNVFKDNHISLYRCLHSYSATSITIIEIITNMARLHLLCS